MRMICPNCGAQYEVDDNVIPDNGRDVQCSNCGHTWFHRHGDQDTDLAEELGDEVPVALCYDGREYTGHVTVQTVGDLGRGRIRYGFRCVQDRRCGGTLQQGLQVVNASVQRLLIKHMVRI